MKYCPNASCRTLLEAGIVAEYEDHVVYCVDCGTELISADAPPRITPQPLAEPMDEWQEEERHVKYCPNPDCPTLVELGYVAEYAGETTHCEECGAQLVPVYTEDELTEHGQPAGYPGDSEEESALLGTFVAWEDVAACLREGERIGFPIMVKKSSVELEAGEEGYEEQQIVPAFDLIVLRRDLFRAMSMLDEVFDDDTGSDLEALDDDTDDE